MEKKINLDLGNEEAVVAIDENNLNKIENDKPRIVEIRDNIATQKGNIAYFATPEGMLLDEGAHRLEKLNKPITHKKLEEDGNVVVQRAKNKTYYRLSAHGKTGLTKALVTLAALLEKFSATNITFSKSPEGILTLNWRKVQDLIIETFKERDITILFCQNLVNIPDKEIRAELISEAHASAIGGHKGVTKTHGRLKKKLSLGWDETRSTRIHKEMYELPKEKITENEDKTTNDNYRYLN